MPLIALIVSRFNTAMTSELLAGAERVLTDAGVHATQRPVFWVPGAVELPQAAMPLAKSGQFDAIIAFGVVIRGDTTHYDTVCQMAADGLQRVSLDTGVPVVFGVLTCENETQVWDRLGRQVGKKGEGHKGEDAARTALEMIDVLRQIKTCVALSA
ncbi:MAG: 6,7-dimethyl-8-ribityllumazine synthase [Vampirovibrionales bacterium]|nr:6,7-dimethyl-8-ribityllumazine synthase [Vampirovibrionales bacterium]